MGFVDPQISNQAASADLSIGTVIDRGQLSHNDVNATFRSSAILAKGTFCGVETCPPLSTKFGRLDRSIAGGLLPQYVNVQAE